MGLTFPILDRKTILEFLVEGGYSQIEEQDLLKPTRDAIWPLYECLMQDVMGVSRDELQQPVFSALEYLHDAELHEESVGCLASFRNISKIMYIAGVPDFSMNDIYKPESSSTIRNLSALINFAKFKEEKERMLSELTSRRESVVDRKEQAHVALQRIKAQVQELQASRLAEQPAVLAKQEEIKQMKQQIVGYNKQHAALRAEQRSYKEEYNNLADQISHVKFQLSQAKQLGSELKGQIVQSPEKLQKVNEEKRQSLEIARKHVEDKKSTTRSLKKKQEALSKAEQKVRKYVTMMEDYGKQAAEQKQGSKELKALKAKVKECEKERWAFDARYAQSRLEGKNYLEQVDEFGRQATLKLQEVEKDLQACTAKSEPVLANLRSQIAQQTKFSETQHQDALQKLAKMQTKKDTILSEGAAEIAMLQNKVREYNKVVIEDLSRLKI